ncbi:hypothetical protein Kpho02_50430 [Kitasatospora phosalacinea]|uniref:Lipoprotein n=1 Tax=Kitasatospora phosalacinea TaxID=2065 RepID=A0A9W6QCV7_9ACTN|nr:hypothetical protein [Kitasatospora phosalacinea]GLW72744.1 hypothetical protein Kpho02_50430 [Kitasatospora phosalacinea]
MSGRLAAALAAAAFAVTGCTTATEPQADGPPSAPAPASPSALAPASVSGAPGPACSAAPSPTESYEGNWKGPLPEEVRCLPHIAEGSLSFMADGPTPDGWKALDVRVTPDTDPEQARALCHRITELGWGTGGSHGVTLLAVSGAGHFTSTPDLPVCFDGDRSTLPPAAP